MLTLKPGIIREIYFNKLTGTSVNISEIYFNKLNGTSVNIREIYFKMFTENLKHIL